MQHGTRSVEISCGPITGRVLAPLRSTTVKNSGSFGLQEGQIGEESQYIKIEEPPNNPLVHAYKVSIFYPYKFRRNLNLMAFKFCNEISSQLLLKCASIYSKTTVQTSFYI